MLQKTRDDHTGIELEVNERILDACTDLMKVLQRFSYTLTPKPASVYEARWPSGRASDSEVSGQGFDPHSGRRVVSLNKIHLPPKKYW